jgi:YD repeat-containing protein
MAGCDSVTDANSNQTSYGFDQVNQIVKTVDGKGNVLESGYTSDSQVSALSDGVSTSQAVFAYDSAASGGSGDRLDSVASPTGAQSTFTYQSGSTHPYQPDSTMDSQGNCRTFLYDNPQVPVSNLISSTDGLPSTCTGSGVSFTKSYEGDNSGSVACGAPSHKGDLCSTKDGNNNTTNYHYDINGNLTSVTYPTPLAPISQTPDPLSRRASFTDGRGQKTSYSYDTLDRVIQIRYKGTTSCANSATCTSFSFDSDGNLTSRSDATGIYTFNYNHLNQLTKKVMAFGTPIGCNSSQEMRNSQELWMSFWAQRPSGHQLRLVTSFGSAC